MLTKQAHWRVGERSIDWIEQAVDRPKSWTLLTELPPSSNHVTAFEAEVRFVTPSPLEERGTMWLRSHEEQNGQLIVNLWQGNTVLRRAHIGANHKEPEDGPLISGPHVHFPTSAFPNISSRGSRSRAYRWDVEASLSLRLIVQLFVLHVNISSIPSEQQRLSEG